jgi:hypothetical protein
MGELLRRRRRRLITIGSRSSTPTPPPILPSARYLGRRRRIWLMSVGQVPCQWHCSSDLSLLLEHLLVWIFSCQSLYLFPRLHFKLSNTHLGRSAFSHSIVLHQCRRPAHVFPAAAPPPDIAFGSYFPSPDVFSFSFYFVRRPASGFFITISFFLCFLLAKNRLHASISEQTVKIIATTLIAKFVPYSLLILQRPTQSVLCLE